MAYRFACLAGWLLLCLPPAFAQTAAPPPTLAGRTAQGAAVDLAQLRGKVVLLFFWSTDCAVCLDKLPELRRNLAGWRGRPFEIVAVNQDRSMAALKDYEQLLDRIAAPDPQMRMVWRSDPLHRDSFGELPARAPTSVVIDRAGQVVKTIRGRLPPELWDDIAELVVN